MSKILATNLNLNGNEIEQFRAESSEEAPQSPVPGQIYYNSLLGCNMLWNGIEWVPQSGYTHPNGGASGKPLGLYRFSTDGTSHILSAVPVTKQDIIDLGVAGEDTTYSLATDESDGLMSSEMHEKLSGISTQANKVTFSRTLNSGTKIGTLSFDGTPIDLYCETNTDTHYNTQIFIGENNGIKENKNTTNPVLKLFENGVLLDGFIISGSGATSVASDSDGNVTISSTDTTYNNATTSVAGLMSAADKEKLDSIEAGAQVNAVTSVGAKTGAITLRGGLANNGDINLTIVGKEIQAAIVGLGSAAFTSSDAYAPVTNGKIPASYLPGFVDDVIEGYLIEDKFYEESAGTTEIEGESGKIYIDKVSNKTYRYSGSSFVVISETLAIGTTASTALAGNTLYAGAATQGGSALSAVKLDNSADAGSGTQPIYFANGVPVATTYTLGKSVPADAVFTDTHYTVTAILGGLSSIANATSDTEDPFLNLIENGTKSTGIQIKGGGDVVVTAKDGILTISTDDTDTDTHYTAIPILGGSSATSNADTDTTNPYLNIIENGAKSGGIQIKGGGATTVVAKDGAVTISSTDQSVTAVGNHYTPVADANAAVTANASGASAQWEIDVVKGVTISKDEKGHVTGVSVTSGKIPANPNTDRYVNAAVFTDDTTVNSNSPVKMTLTRNGSDSVQVEANIPKITSSSAGVVPKGSVVNSQSQSTKFLREDGAWSAPSYTTNTDTTVDSAAHHYTPTKDNSATKSATGATGTSGSTIQVITGIETDGKGHVTGVISGAATDTTYNSIKNPYGLKINTDSTDVLSYDGSAAQVLTITGGTNKITISDGTTSKDIAITPSITNNVIGSSLTSNYIILGNGNSTIKASSVQIETALTAASNAYIPTSKAIADYVSERIINATQLRGGFDASSTDGSIDNSANSLKSIAESRGDVYIVTTAGTFLGKSLDVGDSIEFLNNVAAGTAPVAADVIIVQGTVKVTNGSSDLAWGTDITVGTVEGVNITAKLPSNPNTDRYINSAVFVDDTTANVNSPVKMTLTRAGSDTATVVANLPKVSTTSAGVAPKGSVVGTQSQSTKFLREDGSWAAPSYTTNTDTSVTSVANHYAPETNAESALTANASGATAAWSIDVVKGLTISRDAKGHVTGVSVTSGKVPANPNTDRYVNTAAFASQGTNGASGVKLTLTRAGSDSTQVTATMAVATTEAAGAMSGAMVTKLNGIEAGAQVHIAPTSTEVKNALGTGSGTSKYLREDGTWVTPPNDNTTYNEATTSVAGLMSAADKTKLNGIATGATANVGTITGITMNNVSKGTSGVVDLGTVITDVSGKADKASTVSTVSYDATNKKFTKTINGTTTDIVSVATLKTDLAVPAAANDGAFSIKTKVGTNNAVTVADFTANQSSADDLTLIQGSNITLTTDATNRTITIAATDTTYGVFSSSANGLAPSTASGNITTAEASSSVNYLCSDGKWRPLPAGAWKTGTVTSTNHTITVLSGKKSNGSTDITATSSSAANPSVTLGDSGVTAGSYGDSANQTPTYGNTFKVPYVTVNAKGIVTGISDHTVKMPSNADTVDGLHIVKITQSNYDNLSTKDENTLYIITS